jgi:hypothetical protein
MTWVTPPTKAVGDVLYAADINTISDDLTMLAHPPLCAVYKSTTQSIANSTGTNLIPNVILVDQDPTGTAIYSAATGRMTIRTAGLYSAEGQVQYQSNGSGSGTAQSGIQKNGADIVVSAAAGQPVTQGVSVLLETQRLVVGDFLQVRAFQDSGSARTQDNQAQGTFFALRFEGL